MDAETTEYGLHEEKSTFRGFFECEFMRLRALLDWNTGRNERVLEWCGNTGHVQ